MAHARRKLKDAGVKPAQPSPDEQSGSTGRPAPEDEDSRGKDTGQGRYGQSGLAGGASHTTGGEEKYRRSDAHGDQRSKADSNRGSGRADRENRDYLREDADPRRPAKPGSKRTTRR